MLVRLFLPLAPSSTSQLRLVHIFLPCIHQDRAPQSMYVGTVYGESIRRYSTPGLTSSKSRLAPFISKMHFIRGAIPREYGDSLKLFLI